LKGKFIITEAQLNQLGLTIKPSNGKLYIQKPDGTELEIALQTDLASVSSRVTTLETPIAAKVTRQLSDQTIPTGTDTRVQWDTEVFDYGNMVNLSSNNTRIYAPVKGLYAITAGIMWAANSTGLRAIKLGTDSTNFSATFSVPLSGTPTIIQANGRVILNAGEYIQVWARQTSGANLNISASVYNFCEVQLVIRL